MNTVASVGGLVAWGPDGMLQCLLWCGGSCCCHSSVRSMSWSELAVLLALPSLLASFAPIRRRSQGRAPLGAGLWRVPFLTAGRGLPGG